MLGWLLISSPPSSENRPHPPPPTPPSPALHEQCPYLPLHVSDHEGSLTQVMVITLSYNTKVFQDIFWICLSLQGLNKILVLVVFLFGFNNYKETSKQSNKRNEFSLVLHDRWGDHMRDYMDRRVTPPERVTWPTLGLPPPRKQALSVINLNMRIRL